MKSSASLRALAWPCLSIASTLLAADWANWRGPDGLGVSPESTAPLTWSKDEHVAWKAAVPGRGASSPIVVGNRVYLTSQTPDQGLHLLAYDQATGKPVWDREIARGKLHAHDLHNMATPTAVSDGKRIWVLFGTGDLACVEADSRIVWQRNLVKEFGPLKTNHGYGSSPMLDGDQLYVVRMHQGPDSYVLALDAQTGKDRWKQDRSNQAREEGKDSYSSPIFHRFGGQTEVIVAGAEVLNAYDPATGKVRWSVNGLDVPHPYGRTIAGPTAGEGVVVAVTSGFQNRGATVGIRAGGQGDITTTHKLWTATRFAPDCPTPVIAKGMLFSIRDDGMASCLDLKTGEARWQERLFTDNVKVSPLIAAGRVYFTSGQGNTTVVQVSPKLEVLARNSLNEATLGTPAVSGGRFYLRTETGLYCFTAE
jgi:outer membrane protein assembly factor BamB